MKNFVFGLILIVGIQSTAGIARAERGGVSGGGGEDQASRAIIAKTDKVTYVECRDGSIISIRNDLMTLKNSALIIASFCESPSAPVLKLKASDLLQ